MRLQLYVTKQLVLNPYEIGWGLLFIIFWLFLGAFVESSRVPPNVALQYTAGQFALLVILSASSVGIGVSAIVYYLTGAIAHLIRYSKARGKDFLSGIMLSGLITGISYSLIILALTYVVFSYCFGISLPPANILEIIVYVVLTSLFFTTFSTFLELFTVKYLGFNPGVNQIASFIPFILGYGFAFVGYYLNLGDIAYASPFTEAEYLLAEGYYGRELYLT